MEQEQTQTNQSKLIKENKRLKEENEELKKQVEQLAHENLCLLKFVGVSCIVVIHLTDL